MKKLYISGNYIIAEQPSITTEYSMTQSVYELEDGSYRILEHLDKGQLIIPVADIGDWYDEAGVVAFTETTLKEFLRANTGVSLSKSSESTSNTVTVDDIAAVTLLVANPNRLGYSVSNTGIVDVVIRFYPAAQDNNIDGWVLHAGEIEILDNVSFTGEISSIRLTTAGTQTADIIVTEW